MLKESSADLPDSCHRLTSAYPVFEVWSPSKRRYVGEGVTQDKAWQAELQLDNGFSVLEVSLPLLMFINN